MNFFAQQEAARKRTFRLVLIYVIAIAVIVAALDIVFATAMIFMAVEPQYGMNPLLWITHNQASVLLASLGIIAFIGIASLYRIISTKGGGGSVARSMGGTRVIEDVRDPAVRQLVNVVEEMAIASGLPVPEIYVLENESGINAFAAGFDSSDAAIAVTRGALDAFNRQELQGVIGHEFSHILNGDMRLNMRLLGPLFGIMLISMMGRIILRGMGRTRTRSSKEGAGGMMVILLLGAGLTVIGYIGYLAGQMIKAAVSRQREYLADSSAVQFTRNPEGITGALKKIAAWQYGSQIINDGSEEISHMLFANGFRKQASSFLATHPPLQERITRLGSTFSNSDLAKLAVKMGAVTGNSVHLNEAVAGFSAGTQVYERESQAPGQLHSDSPELAGSIISGVPVDLYEAAHDTVEVRPVVIALLLDPDDSVREQQLVMIDRQENEITSAHVMQYWQQVSRLTTELHLPLLELAFPAVRRLTWQQQSKLLRLVDGLITINNAINSFEYLLSRLLLQSLQESQYPRRRVQTSRRRKLYHYQYELGIVFSVLADFGHASHDIAVQAYAAGLYHVSSQQDWPVFHVPDNWPTAMDDALRRLDTLRPFVKEELIESLKVTADYDTQSTSSELELLRVIAGLMHIPMPPEYRLFHSTD
jgi:Zn-dependent protease with chaperone function